MVCLLPGDLERQRIHPNKLFYLTKNEMTECTLFWPSFSSELGRSLSFSGVWNLTLLNFSLFTPSIPPYTYFNYFWTFAKTVFTFSGGSHTDAMIHN